ncbi:MAG TPA: hypothetical protein VKX28_23860 [Xanthobacteraceae bacterium]|nr:hypothetical protein [Xanthobacteraceae bacterium]
MKRLLRFLLPIIFAVVLGPFFAGLAVCLYAASQWILDPGPIAELLGLSMLYMMFAYVLGWPIALVGGLLMSIWMIFRAPGIVGVLAAAVAAVGLLWLAAAADLMGPLPNLAYGMVWLTLAVSVVAALACWLVTRPFASQIAP